MRYLSLICLGLVVGCDDEPDSCDRAKLDYDLDICVENRDLDDWLFTYKFDTYPGAPDFSVPDGFGGPALSPAKPNKPSWHGERFVDDPVWLCVDAQDYFDESAELFFYGDDTLLWGGSADLSPDGSGDLRELVCVGPSLTAD